ncbi:MAG TPA: DUF4136 domain-containing protein [Alphaproteobacteria bacterium]|nr:DUF4136 domain-containing protein [Alphaproteobacteria bacterium]
MGKLHALVAGFLVLMAPQAWAQATAGPPTGSVTARAYAPLPPGAAISVVASEDTDQYQRLKAAIEASLRARGYAVSDNAPFLLKFYATEVLGNRVSDKTNGALALESSVPNNDQTQSMGVLAPLNQNLFGGETASGTTAGAASSRRQVHLSMMLSDQRAAKRVWQGSASGEMRRPDSFAATQSLVPFLVDKVGRTVTDERFDVP